MFLLYVTLGVFILACCLIDQRTRRIPNVLSGIAFLVGSGLNTFHFGAPGLATSLSGAATMVAILLAPFALGGIGAGDVKMMAAVGAFVGPILATLALTVGMIIGGVIMTVHLMRVGRLAEKLAATKTMILSTVLTGSVEPLRIAAADPAAISLPYSIPLGLGTALVVTAKVLHP